MNETTPPPSPKHDPLPTLANLAAGRELTDEEAHSHFAAILADQLDDAQIAATLALLAARGPSAAELTGAARAMRERVTPVPVDRRPGDALIDTCGTGGAAKTFNVSTAAALIAAGATPPDDLPVRRVLVAKHGNRSRTGRGSAEVLAALGIHLDATPDQQARCLEHAGVCFSFAMRHHPAMRAAAGPRRSLGFPTVFNLLGPLTNPAGATRQLIGVYHPGFITPIARALAALGCERAIIAHGAGDGTHAGLDEFSTLGPTTIARVETGIATPEETIDPASLGLARPTMDQLRCGTADESARAIRAILAGDATPDIAPKADIARLNAAAALHVAGAARDLAEGLALAAASIESGRAAAALDALRDISHRPPSDPQLEQ